jgi:predicted  nucleic acid-binding Zn ribbon protein
MYLNEQLTRYGFILSSLSRTSLIIDSLFLLINENLNIADSPKSFIPSWVYIYYSKFQTYSCFPTF